MAQNLPERQFIGVALRLEQVARQGNGNGLITVQLLVDGRGDVRHMSVKRQALEPKNAPLDWLLDILGE